MPLFGIIPRSEEKQKVVNALFAAARDNNIDEVTRLLDDGSTLKTKDDSGQTPLHSASSGNGSVEMIELLLKRGAKVNAKDDHGMTPLHYASQFGRHDLMQALIDAGAKVNATAEGPGMWEHGVTPLHLAVRDGNPKAIEVLLNQKGIDVNAQTERSKSTALHFAANVLLSGKNPYAQANIDTLLASGADKNLADKGGVTASDAIARANHVIKLKAEVASTNMQNAAIKFQGGYTPSPTNGLVNVGDLPSPLSNLSPTNTPVQRGK
jgi:ankyrin repeat protein